MAVSPVEGVVDDGIIPESFTWLVVVVASSTGTKNMVGVTCKYK